MVEMFFLLVAAIVAGGLSLILVLALLAILIRGLIWFFPAMIQFFKDMSF